MADSDESMVRLVTKTHTINTTIEKQNGDWTIDLDSCNNKVSSMLGDKLTMGILLRASPKY